MYQSINVFERDLSALELLRVFVSNRLPLVAPPDCHTFEKNTGNNQKRYSSLNIWVKQAHGHEICSSYNPCYKLNESSLS